MSGVQINKNSISICTLPIFGKYLIRHKQFLSFEAKRVLVNSSFYLLFNYCPLVWTFAGAKSLNKIRGYLGNILFSSLASFVVFFFCFFLYSRFFFCLFVCFLKLKIYIAIHIRLCGRVSDIKIFTRPISGNKITFFLALPI